MSHLKTDPIELRLTYIVIKISYFAQTSTEQGHRTVLTISKCQQK